MLSTTTANNSFSKPLALDSIGACWEFPEEIPRLDACYVHVWKVDLDVLAAEAFPQRLADCVEAEETFAYRHATDRARRRTTRMALRTILAGYICVDAMDIRFERTAFGKPMLHRKDKFENLQFNVSYSGATALIGVCKGAGVGVDVERVDPQFPVSNVLRRFSNRGLFAIDHPKYNLSVRSFFELWTRNEAYAKATGRGLSGLAAENASAPFTHPRCVGPDGWSITSFDVESDLVAAIATSFKPTAILFLNYKG